MIYAAIFIIIFGIACVIYAIASTLDMFDNQNFD